MSGASGTPRRGIWILVVLCALAACSAEPPSSAPSAKPQPIGIVAIGHSGLTGEGTAEPTADNSWATGTNPKVNSIYLRLTAANPEHKDHVANTASGGAHASELQSQAERALTQVTAPALVIIATIDNDIRCDGTDQDHVAEFGQSVRAALNAITQKSPDSRILVVGQAGRPDPAFVRKLVSHTPNAKAAMTGSGICDFYNPAGELVPAHFQALTAIIEAYEAEQARVCGEFQHCRTDGGVRAAYQDKLQNLGPDWSHLNTTGQAEQATIIWPVVQDLLN
ncbi:SGNH/GDSL hydrolase family protein [Kribbella sp. CA-253562]|uniref:SGNH/GDSL hydrolase family protein n=1 Tax=Kribbella sp. CA-253562 TaxID=3239942 RepID=UPI003D92B79D